MKNLVAVLLASTVISIPTFALAQSSPGLATGQVPSAVQWNGYFSAKQDYVGTSGSGVILLQTNPVIASPTLSGSVAVNGTLTATQTGTTAAITVVGSGTGGALPSADVFMAPWNNAGVIAIRPVGGALDILAPAAGGTSDTWIDLGDFYDATNPPWQGVEVRHVHGTSGVGAMGSIRAKGLNGWPDQPMIISNKLTIPADGTAATLIEPLTLTGNLLFSADATYTIGASGANRPTQIYASSLLSSGGNVVSANGIYPNGTSKTIVFSAVDGNIEFVNSGNSNFNLLNLGMPTSAFPAWKRNGTSIEARLGDDSADTGIIATTGTFSSGVTGTAFATNTNNAANQGSSGATDYAKLGIVAFSNLDAATAGTVAAWSSVNLGVSTLTSTNARTYTNATNLYVAAPVASTNVTITNPYAIIAAGNILQTGSIFQIGPTSSSGSRLTAMAGSVGITDATGAATTLAIGTIHTTNVRTTPTTVSALPSAATAGAGSNEFVTDSSVAASGNFGAIVAGSGTNGVPVYSDGTNWRIG